MIEPTNWPQVPEKLRPKALFVTSVLDEVVLASLQAKGWAPQDLRLWPNTSLNERQALVLAWLEGLRVGSIDATPRIYDTLELEAKTCGLTSLKQVPDKPKDLSEETIENILDLQVKRPTRHR